MKSRVVAIAGAVSIAACFSKPPAPGTSRGDAGGDAPIRDSPSDGQLSALECPGGGSAVLFDDFNGVGSGTAACGQTGSYFGDGNGKATRGLGALVLGPVGSGASHSGCTWDPFPTQPPVSRLIVVWKSLATPIGNDATEAQIDTSTQFQVDLQLVFDTGLKLLDTTTTTGNPLGTVPFTGQRFWRLAAEGSAIVAEVSSDGMGWQRVGASTPTSGPADIIKLTIDYQSDDSQTQSQGLDALYYCP